MRFKSIAALAALAPLLLAAGEPLRLQPSGGWVLDYAENSCRLIRTFGEEGSQVKITFESSAPGQMDLFAYGKPLKTSREQVPAKFVPVQTKTFEGHVAETVAGHEPVILWTSVPMLPAEAVEKLKQREERQNKTPGVRPPAVSLAERAELRAQRARFATGATALSVEVQRNRPVILETGSLGAAIAAFDKCTRDSLRDWGVDPDLEDKIVRHPWAPNPAAWFTSDDYPSDMLYLGAQSDVKVRLLVDATGHVTKCTSLSHFDRVEFNKATCDKFMKRAVFQPAEVADGTKVPSYYTQVVTFRMGY